MILKKHVREVIFRLHPKVASRCHALGNELGEDESARKKNGMEVAEIAGHVSALIEYTLSCEVTEVGDAILECDPNVCAGTDAVKMFGLCGDHRSQMHDTSCRVLLDKGWYSRVLSGSSRFLDSRPNRGGKSAMSTPFVEDLTAQSCCSEQCGPVALCETAFVQMSF